MNISVVLQSQSKQQTNQS